MLQSLEYRLLLHWGEWSDVSAALLAVVACNAVDIHGAAGWGFVALLFTGMCAVVAAGVVGNEVGCSNACCCACSL